MTNGVCGMRKRDQPNGIDRQLLYSEVDNYCPRCKQSLLENKGARRRLIGEAAHIYPLNPTLEDSIALKGIPEPDDINGLDNFIILCPSCHDIFDNPRTREEYLELYNLKKEYIEKRHLKNLYAQYGIQDEIRVVVDRLSECDFDNGELRTVKKALKIEGKVGSNFDFYKRRSIENNVVDYFRFIQNLFSELDASLPGTFECIACEVRAFYLSAARKTDDKLLIFESVSEWIRTKAGLSVSLQACEIVASFFVQNCEVFSDATQ